MKRLLAVLLLLSAPPAFANPFELYGFTPRAMGLGGAMTAIGDELGASFYNPGALLGHTKTEFGIGFADTLTSGLYVDRSNGTSKINNSTAANAPRFELGLIFPLGGSLLKDRVVLAIGGGHPLGGLIRVQTVDPPHPHFSLSQSNAHRSPLPPALPLMILNSLP